MRACASVGMQGYAQFSEQNLNDSAVVRGPIGK